MKTLKTIMLGLALMLCLAAAKAANQPAQALTKNDIVTIYTDAVIHGRIVQLDKILANNVQYEVHRGEKLFKLNRQNILDSFKASENVEQTCKYATSIVDDNPDGMVVKLEMNYGSYVRTNLITISHDHSDWKITKIEVGA